MDNKIKLSQNKTLKLSNVLIKEANENEYTDLNKVIELMENYIKSKGAMSLGPLIQYTSMNMNENGEMKVTIKLMRQTNHFINSVEVPYSMESVICIRNCMYVRYNGPEEKLKFAYDKIQLAAFEDDLRLKGDSYTVFVNQQNDTMVADVFMEKYINE